MRYPGVRQYPKILHIGDSVWHIAWKRSIIEGGTKCDGLCDPSTNTIFIRLGLTPKDRMETFIHEVLHAFEAEFDYHIEHKLVYQLEKSICHFLIHNF